MTTRIIQPDELTADEHARMLALMTTHYDHVHPETFARDLADKDRVILLEEDGIIGFSTQKILTMGDARAVFSGDTIIDRAHWGTQQLSRAFAQDFFDAEGGPLYWFLISKGYKTYKYLPTFFQTFYPRYDEETPPDIRKMIDHFGKLVNPVAYRPETGVFEYTGEKDRLKAELQDLSARNNDPHYEFFVRANPGYRMGHDLACLTLLTRENLKKGRARLLFGEGTGV